jgi:predicted glycoside hydrolase/deacetylase ChbG (UPF0249 family)
MPKRSYIAVVAFTLVACSAQQKAEVTETTFKNDQQRTEMLEATLRVMDAHPEYVDELFRLSRSHPRTLNRLFANTARAMESPSFRTRSPTTS